ncbi:uncharacterized protein LOC143030701 [Oratosquilla oratoria]|uniref:uncharacterized protein LOC143030701 n=1 Tax=Oratosquilla oratoria TaxID=337810 RepID=UPI003F775067
MSALPYFLLMHLLLLAPSGETIRCYDCSWSSMKITKRSSNEADAECPPRGSSGLEPPVKNFPDGYGCVSIDEASVEMRNVILTGMEFAPSVQGCSKKITALGTVRNIKINCFCTKDLCNTFPSVKYHSNIIRVWPMSDDTLESSKSDVHCSDLALGSALLTSSLLFLFQTLA